MFHARALNPSKLGYGIQCGVWRRLPPVGELTLTGTKRSLGLLTTSGTTISCARFSGRRADARWLVPQPVTIRSRSNAHYRPNAVRQTTRTSNLHASPERSLAQPVDVGRSCFHLRNRKTVLTGNH